MSKKIYLGLLGGLLAGIAVPVILKLKRDEELFSEEDLSHDNYMLDNASHYLLHARNKVDEMVDQAKQKSDSMIEEAGKILSSAREMTSSVHSESGKSAEEKINEIKEEIDKTIEEFRRKNCY